MRRPISRVRSVTETSMMFMMPTPPTTSEISRHDQQQVRHQFRRRTHRLHHFRHVADGEIIRHAGAQVMPFAQQRGDFVDGRWHFVRRLRRRRRFD